MGFGKFARLRRAWICCFGQPSSSATSAVPPMLLMSIIHSLCVRCLHIIEDALDLQHLLALSCPRLKATATVGVEPDVHLPCPGKVVIRVVNVTPISVLVFDFVVPDLVDLQWARIMAIPFRVPLNDVETPAFRPSLVKHIDQ